MPLIAHLFVIWYKKLGGITMDFFVFSLQPPEGYKANIRRTITFTDLPQARWYEELLVTTAKKPFEMCCLGFFPILLITDSLVGPFVFSMVCIAFSYIAGELVTMLRASGYHPFLTALRDREQRIGRETDLARQATVRFMVLSGSQFEGKDHLKDIVTRVRLIVWIGEDLPKALDFTHLELVDMGYNLVNESLVRTSDGQAVTSLSLNRPRYKVCPKDKNTYNLTIRSGKDCMIFNVPHV